MTGLHGKDAALLGNSSKKFVAVSYHSSIVRSDDGLDWEIMNVNGYFVSVCYGKGKYVAVGESTKFGYSADGINWEVKSYGEGISYRKGICCGK